MLNLGFAERAKLKVGPMDQKIYGIGGEAPAALGQVPVMRIGDSVIEDREVLVADLFKDSGALEGQGEHDALFGADFLRELDAVISYKENRMFLRPEISDQPGSKNGAAAGTKPSSSPEKK